MSNNDDRSTSRVMDWIDHLGGKCLRINKGDELKFSEIDINSNELPRLEFECKGSVIKFDKINSFWYRRGDVFTKYAIELSSAINDKLKGQVYNHLSEELKTLRAAVHFILESKISLGRKGSASVNKLIVLMTAQKLGIDIPHTIIGNKSLKNHSLLEQEGAAITKSMSESPIFKFKNHSGKQDAISTYTIKISSSLLDRDFDELFPTMIQEKLDKKIELRIFYLKEEFYAMAIFSQLDKQTSLDFRKYNFEKPNRTMPFQLPSPIKNKLTELMGKLNLDTGSIDMILTKDNRYVLLEINPIGQFGMVSHPCNYNLEGKIAEFLLNQN